MSMATPSSVGGYGYDFVESPHNRLICKICHFPSRDPYLSVCCGHVFCKSCQDNVKKAATITSACPVCRDKEFCTFPQKEADREIRSLHIYCTNKGKGCEWQDELNDINNHLGNSNGCQFVEVKCSNGCGKMIQRQYLTNHVETECPRRKANCQYCHVTGEHHFIEGQHKEECLKFLLPCPNKCEVGSVPREDMEAHMKDCPLEMIQCRYHDVGCEAMIAHRDQEMHENEEMKEHLMKTKRELNNTNVELKNTKLDLTSIKDELTDVKTTLANAEATLVTTKTDLATTKATLADTKSDLVATKATLADTKADLSITKATLADINSQLANSLQRISTLEVLLYLASNKKTPLLISRTVVLESSVSWSIKLVTMAMMSESGNQGCPVILKMSEFNKLKTNNNDWYSKPFYSHNRGYKMSLCIYAGGVGDGMGTHLSVFLFLNKGPYDDEVIWPLKGKFGIELLNQISDSEHYSLPVTYHDNTPADSTNRVIEGDQATNGWGKPKSISNENLKKISPTCQYLKNNCLFFQVTKL